jgi:hypothetical protein
MKYIVPLSSCREKQYYATFSTSFLNTTSIAGSMELESGKGVPSGFRRLLPPDAYSYQPRTSRSVLGPPVVHSGNSARRPECGTGPHDLGDPASPRSDRRWSPGRACRSYCATLGAWGCPLPNPCRSARQAPRASRPPRVHEWRCGPGPANTAGKPVDQAAVELTAPGLSQGCSE